MRFTTTAPAFTLAVLATVSSVDNIETLPDGLNTFTVNPEDARNIIESLMQNGAAIAPGRPREHGIAPEPRTFAPTTATIRR